MFNALYNVRKRIKPHIRIDGLSLGLAGTLLAAGSGVAQTSATTPPLPALPAWRLTVQPQVMATGTHNPQAGEYLLPWLSNGYPEDNTKDYPPPDFKNAIYIPKQCEGAVRCPLVLYLFADNDHLPVIDWHRETASKYGMILLSLNGLKPYSERAANPDSNYKRYHGRYIDVVNYLDVKRVDAALKHVLHNFAVNPNEIAVISRAFGAAVYLGRNNPDVFSRIAELDAFQADWTKTLIAPSERNTKTLFFLLGSPGESKESLPVAQSLRQDGYTAMRGLSMRGHAYRVDDFDFMYQWFRDSWAAPPGLAVAEPVPVLTAENLAAMTAFWPHFSRLPASDSIQMTYRKVATILVGAELMSVRMVDLQAVAAKYPSIDADLKAAGLTISQADACIRAIIGASIQERLPADTTSVLSHNMQLMRADGMGELSGALTNTPITRPGEL